MTETPSIWNKTNKRLLYVNFLLAAGIALIAAVSAFTGPVSAPPSGNATGVLGLNQGGTGTTTSAGARANLGAAASGPNSDITGLSPSGDLTLSPSGNIKISQNLMDTSGNIIYSPSTGKIPAAVLPFNKGDLLAPGDRPLSSGLSQYLSDYFNIANLGISGNTASNVKSGTTFGPGQGIVGIMASGSTAQTTGSITSDTGMTITCCPSCSGGACQQVTGWPTASCPPPGYPGDTCNISNYPYIYRADITCPAGYTGAVYTMYTNVINSCSQYVSPVEYWTTVDGTGHGLGNVVSQMCVSPSSPVSTANVWCIK